jgi:hypothetical protein
VLDMVVDAVVGSCAHAPKAKGEINSIHRIVRKWEWTI